MQFQLTDIQLPFSRTGRHDHPDGPCFKCWNAVSVLGVFIECVNKKIIFARGDFRDEDVSPRIRFAVEKAAGFPFRLNPWVCQIFFQKLRIACFFGGG